MTQAAPAKDNRPWILAALMFTIMLAAMDATIVSTAVPQIVGDLGDFGLFSWVFSIYLLAQTVTIPLYGKLADLYGRKPILLFGMVVFMLGSVACGMSWNMHSLIVFRALKGIGGGAIMATVNTVAGDIYTMEERAKIQGWLSSVWGMAAIMGPAVGGFFAEYSTWRWIFFINIPVGVVAMALLMIHLKENVEKRHHHIDYKGAFMMLVSGTLLMYTLIEGGPKWGWLSLQSISFLLVSLVLLLLTIWVEHKSPNPIMPTWLWKNRITLGSNLSMIGLGAIIIGSNMYLPVFAQSVKGLGAIAAGFVLTSSSIGWPIASSQSGRLYLRIGFRNTSMIGTVGIIILCFTFSLYSYESSPLWLVLNQMLLGASFGLLSTPSLVGVQSIVPWEKRGVVTGGNMFSRYLGQSIGAAILGGVFNQRMSAFLSQAPDDLKGQVPLVDDVMDVLQSESATSDLGLFLREAFYFTTQHIYLSMMVIALLTFAVLWLQPRKFPVVKD